MHPSPADIPAVAITGVGAVTALGSGSRTFYQGLLRQESGLRHLSTGETVGRPAEGARPCSHLALEVAWEACASAHSLTGMALLGASCWGDSRRGERALRSYRSGQMPDQPRDLFWNRLGHHPTQMVRSALGCTGPSLSTSWGGQALQIAADWIQRGRVQRALVLASDVTSSWQARLMEEQHPPETGLEKTYPADGAAALLLEHGPTALKRGVTPLAGLLGWGAASGRSGRLLQVTRRVISRAGRGSRLHPRWLSCQIWPGMRSPEISSTFSELPYAQRMTTEPCVGYTWSASSLLDLVGMVLALQREQTSPGKGFWPPHALALSELSEAPPPPLSAISLEVQPASSAGFLVSVWPESLQE